MRQLPLIACCLAVAGATASERPAAAAPPPLIEMAILLDTSGSMNGLIDQARTRLWAIVNDLAKTSRDGRTPDLRVALYEYGNSALAQDGYWIRQVMPLSDDLDALSAALWALTTNGGEEYCGAVVAQAVDGLQWQAGDHYRAIFIAGNEPFSQGPVPYADACARAIARGITVNTIHCGSEADARNGGWIDGARLADGESMNIDQNTVEVAIASPHDADIARLNERLNGTYLAYGERGGERAELQVQQDAANASSVAAFSSRAGAKTSALYRNDAWDLCDAATSETVDLATLPEDQLPAEMRGMDAEQRKAHVDAKIAERAAVQAELRDTVAKREAFVAEQREAQAGAQADGFGEAVRGVLRKQLAAKGYASE